MIDVRTEAYPSKRLVVACTVCDTVLDSYEWETYSEYQSKKSRLKTKYVSCPECERREKKLAKVKPPKWERQSNGDYQAECKNGDFLIWKYGQAYKWRYRVYGGVYANQIGFAPNLKTAKEHCENYPEWIGKGAE